MARLRFILVAAFVLVMMGCPLLEQQENFISFTWDGVQYLFTASADRSDHPYAVGFAPAGEEPNRYEIWGSATSDDAIDEYNTLQIVLDRSEDSWWVWATLYDQYGNWTEFDATSISDGMIDTFITNRDAIGEQFAGSMPGPFQGESPELKDIIFSVERLPNEEQLFD
jgi:hypothetical protein